MACLFLMHTAQALAVPPALPPLHTSCIPMCTSHVSQSGYTLHTPCTHLAYFYLGKQHISQVKGQGLNTQTGCYPKPWFTYGSVALQAAVSALPVAQPFTMATSSPTQEPLLHGGPTPRRKSLARLGPPLPRRRSSDENADTISVSEFEWDASSRADMSIVSRAASSRSRRSSVSISEHAMPQVCKLSHLPCCNLELPGGCIEMTCQIVYR